MEIRNIHKALVELAYSGEEVIICKAGKPMVKLVRYQKEETVRKPDIGAGK